MRRISRAVRAALLVFATGCGSEDDVVVRRPPCDGPVFGYLQWTLDGQPGELCAAMPNVAVTGSPPAQVIGFGIGHGCMLPLGYDGGSLRLYNIGLVSGRSGSLAGGELRGTRPFPSQVGPDGRGVHAEVKLGIDLPGGFECPSMDENRYSIAGTFRVIQGGATGDVVEVEARDVRFLPAHDGQDFRFDWMWWRAIVGEPHDPPDSGMPMDGGGP